MKKNIIFILLSLMLVVSLAACGNGEEVTNNEQNSQNEAQVDKQEQKELLIYCGVTMLRPMTEIAEIIEAQENCKIVIESGGSGDLMNTLKTDKVGDLYLPGSDSYINTLKDEGIVTEDVFVGNNKATILVQKDNPLNITNDLNNLVNEEYIVVIGNPESGSIGKETKKILEKAGVFNDVVENASKLTNDSTELMRVIKDKEADIAINWFATSVWDENKDYVEAIEISEDYAATKKLVIGLLDYSQEKELAKVFMNYASSEEGQNIFNKYGLYEVK